jgi:hypothetical protein
MNSGLCAAADLLHRVFVRQLQRRLLCTSGHGAHADLDASSAWSARTRPRAACADGLALIQRLFLEDIVDYLGVCAEASG